MTLPGAPRTDPAPVPTCVRWRRYGHDRLYVSVQDDDATSRKLGHRDLVTGTDHPATPEDAAPLASAADAWLDDARVDVPSLTPSPPVSAPTSPNDVRPEPAHTPWRDLSRNTPGEAAQVQAVAQRTEAPVRTTVARLLGVHTSERAWRIGAKGERLVAEQLEKLARKDPRWTAIHAIPVGTRGSDIDHLVMGPGGVFTLNAKHHPGAGIWVGGDTFMVNGQRQPYTRNSRHEAERATRLLSDAVGRSVPVTGLVVPVGCTYPMTVKSQPPGVFVVARRDLVAWMADLGEIWRTDELAAVWEAARRSSTWTG